MSKEVSLDCATIMSVPENFLACYHAKADYRMLESQCEDHNILRNTGNGCKNAPTLSSIASLIKAGHGYNAFLAIRRISTSINKRMATPELIIIIRSHSLPPLRLRDV